MTPAQEGAYIRLLAHAWNSYDCAIPDDDRALAVLSRLGAEWESSKEIVRSCFRQAKDGRLVNERLLAEKQKQLRFRKAMSNAGKASAAKRKLGCNQVETKHPTKTNSSSSSSSSSSEEERQSATRICQALVDLWNVGKAAKDWIRVTPKRIAKVQARLKDGFTEQDMALAVSNCLKSEWHQGVNDRGWRAPGPEWVLHTVERAEEWKNKPQSSQFAERRDNAIRKI